jgi:hypothetical protein
MEFSTGRTAQRRIPKMAKAQAKSSGVRVGAVVRGLLKVMRGKKGRKFLPAPRILSEVKSIIKKAA